jgi:RNA polymerase sigma-70 factor, ECF subfamily
MGTPLDSERNDDREIANFHDQLKANLPRLRFYALSITRNRDAADDLVHDTVVKALTGQRSFQPGSNFTAWIFRIQRNEFVSGLRRIRRAARAHSSVTDSPWCPPHQEYRLVMREFLLAFGKLTPAQREAILLAVLDGQTYEAIAAYTGVSVGTVKSRISRARDTLERLLLEDESNTASTVLPGTSMDESKPPRRLGARAKKSPPIGSRGTEGVS